MKQLKPPFSRTHRVFVARIVFLVALAAGVACFASLGVYTSRAARKVAITTAATGASSSVEPAPSFAEANVLGAITVNTTSDVTNGSDGFCTLREAITAANNDAASGATAGECVAASGDDTITIIVSGTINLAGALPAIATNMAINGPGSSLLTVRRDTGGNYGVLLVTNITVVGISGVTISNGKVGGMGAGGGINNAGQLTLTDVVVSGNQTSDGFSGAPNGGSGGGISNGGSLKMINCVVSGNSTGNGIVGTFGNGEGGWGGGIYNSAVLTMVNSVVSGNSTGSGPSQGGQGGGIFSSFQTTLINTTISNNTATGAAGGGILAATASSLTMTNATVTGNTSTTGVGHGVSNSAMTTTIVSNTIIAQNGVSGSGPDVAGTYGSQGHNLVGNATGSSGFTNGSNGDQVGTGAAPVNPLLGPLGNNGGQTQSHALLLRSPAIDAGDNTKVTNPPFEPPPFTDQRGAGFNRSTDGNGDGIATVDIGTYEVQTILVTNTADSGAGSLRQAITDAHSNPDTSAINFQAGLNGTITLLSALPNLSSSISINGPGANLMNVQRSTAGGTPSFRIFKIDMGKTVSISGLTVSNGLVPTMGENGGGILNDGTLTLTDCDVYGNSAGTTMGFGSGGGIYSVGPSVVLNNCKIGGIAAGQPNTSGAGGGGITAFGTLLMNGGSIVGNSESGIAIGGTASLVGVTVTNNTAQNTGGGIRVGGTPAVANILNCTIANNTAVSGGAGIANALGTVTIINSTISGNTSNAFGGGVDSFNATQTTLVNTTVTNNRSNSGGGGGLQNSGGVLLRNTIVAGNFSGASPSTTPSDVHDLLNTNSSANLIGTCTNCGLTNGVNGNQVGVTNPGLGLLADNGGSTLTHALISGSPAVDAGNNSFITNPPFTGPPFTDQRGGSFNRIADGDGNATAIVDIGAYELQGILTIDKVKPPAGRTSGGQQITLAGAFANLSTVTMGGVSASWVYTNGAGDTSSITVTTPAHAVGAMQIDLTPTSGSPYSKANAFAYLPTVFTDDTITVGQTTVKAQHVIELRQAVDAMRAVAGLAPAPWTDGTLTPASSIINAIHIQELRTYLDDAATMLGYSTSAYTDPGLTPGFVIKRIHIEEVRQRIRTIAG